MKPSETKLRIVTLEERVRELEEQKAELLDSMQRLRGLHHALVTVTGETADVIRRAIRDADKVAMPF